MTSLLVSFIYSAGFQIDPYIVYYVENLTESRFNLNNTNGRLAELCYDNNNSIHSDNKIAG